MGKNERQNLRGERRRPAKVVKYQDDVSALLREFKVDPVTNLPQMQDTVSQSSKLFAHLTDTSESGVAATTLEAVHQLGGSPSSQLAGLSVLYVLLHTEAAVRQVAIKAMQTKQGKGKRAVKNLVDYGVALVTRASGRMHVPSPDQDPRVVYVTLILAQVAMLRARPAKGQQGASDVIPASDIQSLVGLFCRTVTAKVPIMASASITGFLGCFMTLHHLQSLKASATKGSAKSRDIDAPLTRGAVDAIQTASLATDNAMACECLYMCLGVKSKRDMLCTPARFHALVKGAKESHARAKAAKETGEDIPPERRPSSCAMALAASALTTACHLCMEKDTLLGDAAAYTLMYDCVDLQTVPAE
ncbi:hypothetical protein KIPB_002319, partial [Kipferlia bialata]|eukprot:g2319.t1